MNTPAQPGQHIIVEKPPRKPWPWSIAITGTIVCVLLVSVAHLAQIGPAIDNPTAVTDIGKYLCERNNGLRRITLRAIPLTYTFTCRDGAVHADVRIHVTEEPQT